MGPEIKGQARPRRRSPLTLFRAQRRRPPPYFFLVAERLRVGTLPPARRASLRPMAIACLRLVTFLPDRPDLSSPRFISRIARSTFLRAFGAYLRAVFFRALVFL